MFLRSFERGDAELYARWRSDPAPMERSGFPYRGPLGVSAAEAVIATALEVQGKPDYRFVLCLLDASRPIGEVFLMHLDHQNRTAEFGIFIGDPQDWGHGYGTDALNATCDFGFGKLDLARVELITLADNAMGRRAYEKAGFIVEGTRRSSFYVNGRRRDQLVMGLLREEWEQSPRPKSWELDQVL